MIPECSYDTAKISGPGPGRQISGFGEPKHLVTQGMTGALRIYRGEISPMKHHLFYFRPFFKVNSIYFLCVTLPENGWTWKMLLFFEIRPIFSGAFAVSFREDNVGRFF